MAHSVTLGDLHFDAEGFINAIIVDAASKQVLTVLQMNKEALQLSMEKDVTYYYSKGYQKVRVKGEESNAIQHIVSITANCERDSLVVEVYPEGPVCHHGNASCYSYPLYNSSNRAPFSVVQMFHQLQDRKHHMPEGSYATHLFQGGKDKILRKTSEQFTDMLLYAKGDDHRQTVHGITELLYHVLALMAQMGITTNEVIQDLSERHNHNR